MTKVNNINTKEAADILYKSEKVQKETEKAQNSYRNKLLDVEPQLTRVLIKVLGI